MSEQPSERSGEGIPSAKPSADASRQDPNFLIRANLRFMLHEMRMWQTRGRIPARLLQPLAAEYAALLSTLPATAPPITPFSSDLTASPARSPSETATDWASQLDIPQLRLAPTMKPMPAPPAPPAPPASPAPSAARNAWSAVTEFLEERNIAALHIVGSLLLLTGILVMIRWQWEGWGRGLLLLFLSALSGGLLYFGRRITEKDRLSGLVLSALGALILPLDLVAFRLFGFLGGNLLDTNATGLLISAVCGGVYALMTRRTRHPLFGGMTALALSAAIVFLPRVFLAPDNGLLPLAHAGTLLPLSYAFFQFANRRRRDNEASLAQPFALTGHGLIAAAFVLSLLGGVTEYRPLIQSLIALVTAVIYADIAVRLRLPRLIYLAAFCVVLASQLAFGWKMLWAERGCAAALTALILQVLNVWYARQAGRSDAEEMQSVLGEAARIYREAALATSALALPPFFVAVCAALFTFTLSESAVRLMQYLAASLMLGGVFAWNGGRETGPSRRLFVYPALAALFAALTAVVGFMGWAMPPFAAWIVPGLCGLLFVAACYKLTDLARRRDQNELAAIFDEAAMSATILSVLSPWIYLPGLITSPSAARAAHIFVVLPGLALLSGILVQRSDGNRRDRLLHLTTLTLGSLSLYVGASEGSLTADWRLVVTALGGAVMAFLFALAASFAAPLRRIVSQNAGILATVTLLPLFAAHLWPSLTPSELSLFLAKTGVAALLIVVWSVLAGTRREAFLLYGAGLMTLLTVWWGGVPLELYLDGWFHAVANPGRWFIYAAPLIALAGLLRRRQSATSPDYAGPIFHTAIAAATLGGLAQITLVAAPIASLSRAGDYAESGIAHLWLLAVGLAFCAILRRRLTFVYAAFACCLMGYAPYSLYDLNGSAWSFSPWWVVLTMAFVGGASLYTAQTTRETNSLLAAQIGAILALLANGHALGQLLPPTIHYAWAILLLPMLGLLTWWNSGQLRETICGLALALLGFFALDLIRWQNYHSPISVVRFALAATAALYSVLMSSIAWRENRKDWFRAALGVASVGFVGWRSGYPDVQISVASLGMTLAIIGAVWYGAARLMRQRSAFGKILDDAALALTTAASVVGFWGGAANADSEVAALITLLVSGGVKAALAFQRPKSGLRHGAFASFFAAVCLFLYHHLGFSIETIDLFLLPLGLYLLSLGAYDLYRIRKTDDAAANSQDEQNAKNTCILGLCFLLGPSLLAVYLSGSAWWHPFLLVTECLASIAVGIAYRQKLFLGFGLGFLIALLALKAYQAIQIPGQQILFALYLLLLGGLVLAMGFFFDRRRGMMRKG